MATNPIIKIIEPILAIGFIIHIIWASVLTLQNQKARPVKYALRNQSQKCHLGFPQHVHSGSNGVDLSGDPPV